MKGLELITLFVQSQSFLFFKLDELSSDFFASVKFQNKTIVNTVIYIEPMIVKDQMIFLAEL